MLSSQCGQCSLAKRRRDWGELYLIPTPTASLDLMGKDVNLVKGLWWRNEHKVELVVVSVAVQFV